MHHNALQSVLEILTVLHFSVFLDRVVIDVEQMWELPSAIHFLILEFVVIEHYSLQMHDEIVWKARQQAPLSRVALFTTGIALVIWYRLSFNEFFKWLIDIFPPFDLKWQVIKCFLSLFDVFALWTGELSAWSTTIDTIEYLSEGSTWYASLQLVKYHVQELLSILLDADVDRVTLEIFKGKTELIRVKLLFFSQFKVGKHVLELMQQVIVNFF